MGAVAEPTTPPRDDTAKRPPIAHLHWDHSNVGLCGTPMQGKPAPPHADRCVVCADLQRRWGL